jgi:hypothetical protein
MDELNELAGVCWLELAGLPLGIRALVTTRLGGVSQGDYGALNLGLHVGDDDAAVLENRRRIFGALDIDPHRTSFMNQVHGTRIATVEADDLGRGVVTQDNAWVATDALLTMQVDAPLVVLSADCAPIIVAPRDGSALAVAHAGWRGSAGAMSVRVTEAFGELGYTAADLCAVIGPTISRDAYEVGDDVVTALRAVSPGDEASWLEHGQRSRVDLAVANQQQLVGAGLIPEHVRITQERSNDELFFSDRRARPCGRMALIAWRVGA